MKNWQKVLLVVVVFVIGLLAGGYNYISANIGLDQNEQNAGNQVAAANPGSTVQANTAANINAEPQKESTANADAGSANTAGPGNSEAKPVKTNSGSAVDQGQLNNILILVNRQNHLLANYVPEDLVKVDARFVSGAAPERRQMRQEAASALKELVSDAEKVQIKLYCVSGYRSYYTQKYIYQAKVKAVGKTAADQYVAYPGQSEHQTGLAMDMTNEAGKNKSLSDAFGQTKEGKWLQENAYLYGFILRYPAGKESITGYNYEPWHIRYVGKEAAQAIKTSGLTLEEYLTGK